MDLKVKKGIKYFSQSSSLQRPEQEGRVGWAIGREGFFSSSILDVIAIFLMSLLI